MKDYKAEVKINPDLCKACGLCMTYCPKQLITMSDDLNSAGQHYAQYAADPDECRACGICYDTCPEPGAIEIKVDGEEISHERTRIPDSIDRYVDMPDVLYKTLKSSLSGKTVLKTGNEAVLYGALLAGCTHFFGYPITPATEVAETAARLFRTTGFAMRRFKASGKYDWPLHDFLQGESEVAVINMLYGAASAGARVMTATSGPGFSLMTEGISYSIGAELPMVIVNVMRGGPGLGNIAPAQADINLLKTPGHGPSKAPILAPNSIQEMCELTMDAFEMAHKYRTPVFVAADGDLGHTCGRLTFPDPLEKVAATPWATKGTLETRGNIINSLEINPDKLAVLNQKLLEKYKLIEENEVRYDTYNLDEKTELVFVAYGSVSQTVIDTIEELKDTYNIGLIRPVTIWPFPYAPIEEASFNENIKHFVVAEQNEGQILNDVKLAVLGRKNIAMHNKHGGTRVEKGELIEIVERLLK